MESDWSSRRKSAMNRARELRSKIHEMHDQRSIENGDDASNAIMSSREIQRQRRSRQLEETQRLLDQFADAEVDDNRRVSSNHSVRSGNVSLYRHGSIEAQVASSQELLGRNHGRDMYSADPNDYAAFEARQLDKKSSSQMIVAESRSVRETSLHRQPGQLGRGRGRGRSGSGGAMSSRQVASSLQSSTAASPRDNDAIEAYNRQGQERNNFSTSIESTPEPQCYYLRDLRVPEHKEGECDKLVVLRQRLAARRRMRELALEGKKGQTIEPSKHGLEKSRNVTSKAFPHEHSTQQHAKHFSHKDVDDSNRSYRSSYNNDATQMNASTGSVSSNVSEKSVVNIELMKCDCCGRSFAPKVYEKHFDSNGQPKCANDKKRPVFNSAKARIANNSNLNQDEQMQVLQANKKVTKDLGKKKNGKGRSMEKIRRSSKWREESRAFRDAMKACRL